MGTLDEKLTRLRIFNNLVHRSDPKLAEETADLGRQPAGLESIHTAQAPEESLALESIVLRRTRPVLAIRDNDTKLDFVDEADSEIWLARLTKAKPLLDSAIRAVGRIDLQGARLDWIGTGWLVAENMLVTNRHVAREFATRKGDGYTFQTGLTGQMSAGIDFLQEIDNPATLVFKLI
jgi:endonuclease G